MVLNNLSVNLKDVLLFSRKAGKYHTEPRDFSSLAYRLDAKGKYLYHGKKLPANTNHISFVPAHISYDQTGNDTGAIVFHFDAVGYPSDEIEVYAFADYRKYKNLFCKALRIWNKKEAGYKYRATAVFYEILAAMQQDCTALEKGGGSVAERAKEYIDSHFSDPSFSIQQLASDVYISDAYLRRRFRQLYQLSPKQYLDRIRLQYAISLLQTGYYTQQEVAVRCGFHDVKYFRSFFKKKTGLSILKYCQNHLN